MVTIPIPSLLEAGLVVAVDISLAIGAAGLQNALTVPADERWKLLSLNAWRLTGDNLIQSMVLKLPAGYSRDTTSVAENRAFLLRNLGTSVTQVVLPNGGEVLASSALGHLLEPGTIIALGPSGAGTAASTFTVQVFVLATKVIRDKSFV